MICELGTPFMIILKTHTNKHTTFVLCTILYSLYSFLSALQNVYTKFLI